MSNHSLSKKQLSRSKLELFIECPRCFHADVALGIGRPGGMALTLNNAVDLLFKREFDEYRTTQSPHALFASVGLDAVPFEHPDLNDWRHNFTGVRWTDAETGWTLFGAIDDVWQNADGRIHVADYKATSKAGAVTANGLHPGYRRQAEVYQFLLRQQGLEISDTAWFVYANGIKTFERFDDCLRFHTVLLPHQGDASWVQDTFRSAVMMATNAKAPLASPGCTWCHYIEKRGRAAAETQAIALVA